ncbi:MAG: hypothetical protein HC803_11120 [Saprospiraceae bacterium]|nr:hypothetical protein [Saprospiraceae bacterium]
MFCKKNFNALIGIIAVLFLVSTEGYIRPHVTRTGDLDSVLIFFITAYTLLFWDYLLNSEQKNKNRLLGIGLLVFAAFMSKSVAGLMPILGLFLGAIFIKKGKFILTNIQTYFVAITTLLLCGTYYLIRYLAADDGYLEKVFFSEYMRFTHNIMTYHEQPFWFHLKNMYERFYQPFIFILPITLIGLFAKNEKFRKTSILGITFCVSYFFINFLSERQIRMVRSTALSVF